MAYLDRPKITVERIQTSPAVPVMRQRVSTAIIGEAREIASTSDGTASAITIPAHITVYADELTLGETVSLTLVYSAGSSIQVSVPYTTTIKAWGTALMAANSDLLCIATEDPSGDHTKDYLDIYAAPAIYQLSIPAISGKVGNSSTKCGIFDEKLPLNFLTTPHSVDSDYLKWSEADFTFDIKQRGSYVNVTDYALKGTKVIKGSKAYYSSTNGWIYPGTSEAADHSASVLLERNGSVFTNNWTDATAQFDLANADPFVIYCHDESNATAGRNFWYAVPSIASLKYSTIKIQLSKVDTALGVSTRINNTTLIITVEYLATSLASDVWTALDNLTLPNSSDPVFNHLVEHAETNFAVNLLQAATKDEDGLSIVVLSGNRTTVTATPVHYQASSGNGKTLAVQFTADDSNVALSGNDYTVNIHYTNAAASALTDITLAMNTDATGRTILPGSLANNSVITFAYDANSTGTETAFIWKSGSGNGPHFESTITGDTWSDVATNWSALVGTAIFVTGSNGSSNNVASAAATISGGSLDSISNIVDLNGELVLSGTAINAEALLSNPNGATTVTFSGGKDAVQFAKIWSDTDTANKIDTLDLSQYVTSEDCLFRIKVGNSQAYVHLPSGYSNTDPTQNASTLQSAIELVLPGVATVSGNVVTISTTNPGLDGLIALEDIYGNAVETAFGISTGSIVQRMTWDAIQVGDFLELYDDNKNLHVGVVTKLIPNSIYVTGTDTLSTVYNSIKVEGIEASVTSSATWKIVRKSAAGSWDVSSDVLAVPGLFATQPNGEVIKTSVYLGYSVKRLDLVGYTINTREDLAAVTPYIPENPLGFAAGLYFNVNQAQVMLYSVDSDATSHMNALNKAFIREAVVIVPLTDDPEILYDYKQAVDAQNDPTNGAKEALLLMAPASPKYKASTSYEENVAVEANDSNTIYFDSAVLDVATVQSDLSTKTAYITVAGYYSRWEIDSYDTTANAINVKTADVSDSSVFTTSDLPSGITEISIEILGDAISNATDWIGAISADVAKFESAYVRYLAPDTVILAVNGLDMHLPTYYVAAMTAGEIAMRNPAIPLNGATIGGISGVVYPFDNFTDRLLGEAAAKGVSFLIQDIPNGPVIYRNFISTNTATVENREHSIVFADMVGARRFRRNLSKWVGPFAMDKKYESAFGAAVSGIIHSLLADGIWKSATAGTVTQSVTDPTKIILEINRTAFMPVLSGTIKIMV